MKINNLSSPELDKYVQENKQKLTEHFSYDFAKALAEHVIQRLDNSYFRSQLVGFDDYISRGDRPNIYFSNHSGMAFPWDAILLISKTFRFYNEEMSKGLRALIDKQLSFMRITNPFMIERFWQKAGGITATFKNFELMMTLNQGNVLLYPEGVPGIAKGFNKKYQLQKFSTSFIKMAVKYRVPLIPVSTVNAEYVNPFMYASKRMNKLAKKIGLPFIPVGWALPVLILQPWLFYYSLPTKMTFVRGEPLLPENLTNKKFDEITEKEFEDIRDRVQGELQVKLLSDVDKYGRKPIHWKAYFKKLFKNEDGIATSLPFLWPYLFADFEEQWLEFSKTGKKIHIGKGFRWFLKVFCKKPSILFYYIPVIGWLPIIWKGKKRYY